VQLITSVWHQDYDGRNRSTLRHTVGVSLVTMDCAAGVQPRKARHQGVPGAFKEHTVYVQLLIIPQSALLCNPTRYAGFGKFAVGILTQPTTWSAAANLFQNAKVKSKSGPTLAK